MKAMVRSPDGDTNFSNMVAGVLWGDTLVSHLFIIYRDYILLTLIDLIKENGFRLKKGQETHAIPQILDTDYVDVPVLLTITLTQTESLLHSLMQVAGGIGLYMSANKTVFMCFKQEEAIFTISSRALKLGDKFVYLYCNILSTESEINIRQAKIWAAINYMEILSLWQNRKMGFLPSCGCVNATEGMHPMGAKNA